MINQINDLYQGLFPDKVVPNIGFNYEASYAVVHCNVAVFEILL